MLTDKEFWKVIAVGGSFCLFCIVAVATGASPLFWLAVACSWAEAALRQAWISALAAANHFKAGFAHTHREVRAEVALGSIAATINLEAQQSLPHQVQSLRVPPSVNVGGTTV